MTINSFHAVIQTSIIYFSNPDASLTEIGKNLGISKQAVAKRVALGKDFFQSYGQFIEAPEAQKLLQVESEISRLKTIIKTLQLQLVIYSTLNFILKSFEEQVHKYFPNFKLSRFSAFQKKRILDYWQKYSNFGGTLRDFCKAIDKCPAPLRAWSVAFEKQGLAGLCDKHSRPHHFSNKIPLWLKSQLLILFMKFPQWIPYQYYKYIKGHPVLNYNISLKTITKLKTVHQVKSEEEKSRKALGVLPRNCCMDHRFHMPS